MQMSKPSSKPDPKPAAKVLPAGAADASQIADLFADVFEQDPVWTALAPRDESRRRVVKGSFARALRGDGHQHFDVIKDNEGNVVAALNYEPPRVAPTPPTIVNRVLNAVAPMLSANAKRGVAHDAAVHSHRPPEPHWYLRDLVASPAARGMGLGSALLKSRLEQVDRDGLPAFLESTTEASKRLYERFGFELVATVEVVDGAKSFIMVRPKKS